MNAFIWKTATQKLGLSTNIANKHRVEIRYQGHHRSDKSTSTLSDIAKNSDGLERKKPVPTVFLMSCCRQRLYFSKWEEESNRGMNEEKQKNPTKPKIKQKLHHYLSSLCNGSLIMMCVWSVWILTRCIFFSFLINSRFMNMLH